MEAENAAPCCSWTCAYACRCIPVAPLLQLYMLSATALYTQYTHCHVHTHTIHTVMYTHNTHTVTYMYTHSTHTVTYTHAQQLCSTVLSSPVHSKKISCTWPTKGVYTCRKSWVAFVLSIMLVRIQFPTQKTRKKTPQPHPLPLTSCFLHKNTTYMYTCKSVGKAAHCLAP